MNRDRKLAKDWLRKSTRTQFYDVIQEAKLLPIQKEVIVEYFVNGKTQIQIAYEHNMSIEHVKNIIQCSYDQVMNVLKTLL